MGKHDEKECSKCGVVKSLDKFYVRKDRPCGQYTSACRKCTNIRNRNWLAKNKEKSKVTLANAHLKRTFGITLAEYDEMLEQQANGCAICGKTPEEEGYRLAVDHDHETDEIRMLLCKNCNTGLGMFQDSPDLLRTAILYLQKFK